MAAYKVPHKIQLVNSLPKNPTGKIMKRFLREQECAITNSQLLFRSEIMIKKTAEEIVGEIENSRSA